MDFGYRGGGGGYAVHGSVQSLSWDVNHAYMSERIAQFEKASPQACSSRVVDKVALDLHCKTLIFGLEGNRTVAVAAVELDPSLGIQSPWISKEYDSTTYNVQLKDDSPI
jgi:hypothetical protein